MNINFQTEPDTDTKRRRRVYSVPKNELKLKDSRVLEVWIAETIIEVENLPVTLKQNILRQYCFDRKSLKGQGLSVLVIERLYRSLFIYTFGLNQMLSDSLDAVEDRIFIMTKYWQVYSILLQSQSKQNCKDVVSVLEKERKEQVNKLKQELDEKNQKLKIIKDEQMERTLQQQNEIEKQRIQNNQLEYEKKQAEINLLVRDDAFNEEVSRRLQFEHKLNQIYSVYNELKDKYELLLQELHNEQEKFNKSQDIIKRFELEQNQSKKEMNKYKIKIQDLQVELNKFQLTISQKDIQHNELRMVFDKVKKQGNQDYKELRHQDHQNQMLKIELKNIQQQFSQKVTENQKLIKQNQEQDKQINSLIEHKQTVDQQSIIDKNTIVELQIQLRDLQEQLKNDQQIITQREHTLQQQNKDKEEIQKQMQQTVNEISMIKLKYSNSDNTIQEQNERIQQIVEEKQQLIIYIESVLLQMNDLKQKQIVTNTEYKELLSDNEVKIQKIKDQSLELQQQQIQNSQIQSEYSNKISSLSNQLSIQRDNNQTLTTLNQQFLNKINLLEAQLTKYQSLYQDQVQTNQTNQLQLDTLREQFKVLKMQTLLLTIYHFRSYESIQTRNEEYAKQIIQQGGYSHQIVQKNLLLVRILQNLHQDIGESVIRQAGSLIQDNISIQSLISEALTQPTSELNKKENLIKVIESQKQSKNDLLLEIQELKKSIIFLKLYYRKHEQKLMKKEQKLDQYFTKVKNLLDVLKYEKQLIEKQKETQQSQMIESIKNKRSQSIVQDQLGNYLRRKSMSVQFTSIKKINQMKQKLQQSNNSDMNSINEQSSNNSSQSSQSNSSNNSIKNTKENQENKNQNINNNNNDNDDKNQNTRNDYFQQQNKQQDDSISNKNKNIFENKDQNNSQDQREELNTNMNNNTKNIILNNEMIKNIINENSQLQKNDQNHDYEQQQQLNNEKQKQKSFRRNQLPQLPQMDQKYKIKFGQLYQNAAQYYQQK